MSGSFDKRGVPLPPAGRDPVGFGLGPTQHTAPQTANDPVTAPPTRLPPMGNARAEPPETSRDYAVLETHVPAEDVAGSGTNDGAAIVPARTVTGGSLTLVIAIMCFFACLTVGAVYLMNKSASGWMQNIASEISVQIEPTAGVDADQLAREISLFLEQQPGVLSASPIPLETSRSLLEPWLGKLETLETLPIPRLIAVQLDRTSPPDLAQVRAALASKFPSAILDDHRQWQNQIRTVTRSFALGGVAILLLVCAATTAIIVSATRSAMLSNREIVEVLHFVGATDRFIAKEFERHFLALGIRAGLVGALTAICVFLAMPTVMELLGGGTMTVAEVKRVIGSEGLDGLGFLLLGGVVIAIAALCMMTSRLGVYRILNTR
jgi:cell division transport system permease protein